MEVDDWLPCKRNFQRDDDRFEPVFCWNDREPELWPCIVEKAFAKAYGSYANTNEVLCHNPNYPVTPSHAKWAIGSICFGPLPQPTPRCRRSLLLGAAGCVLRRAP